MFYREDCSLLERGYVKDLSRINRELRKIVIVDNSPVSYALQPENAIAIKSYFGDQNDQELRKVWGKLELISGETDVPKAISAIHEEFGSETEWPKGYICCEDIKPLQVV